MKLAEKRRIAFVDANKQILSGTLRREEPIDKYYIVECDNGKRYLVTEEEFVHEGEVCSEKQAVKEAPQKRKRGRTRKLG